MSEIGDRVRSVIHDSGLTQRDVATQLGLDDSKLSKSLGGSRGFSSLELALIAEHFDVTVDWLVTGEAAPLATAARSTGGSARGAARRAEQLTVLRTDLTDLGYPSGWTGAEGLPQGSWIEQGHALAAAAHQRIAKNGRDLLEHDLPALIEQVFGVDVAIEDVGEDFDGLAAAAPTATLILANTSPVPARQRFTIAHELGHLLAGDDQEVHLDPDVFKPATKDASEVRANAFAAAFLMPEEALREAVGRHGLSLDDQAALAFRIMVSPLSLAYRLDNLRLIDAGQRDRLGRIRERDAATKAGQVKQYADRASAASTPRPPGLLVRDALAAYEAGAMTLRPYADLIGVPVDDLRQALENDSEAVDAT